MYADLTKKVFDQIIFRPKIQALEKKCYQNGNFCFTPFVMTGNGQNVSKQFLVDVSYSEQFFFEKPKTTKFMILCKILSKISLFHVD